MNVRLRPRQRLSLRDLDWQTPPRDPPLDQLLAYATQRLGRETVDAGRLVLAVVDLVELERRARWYARVRFDKAADREAWLAQWKHHRRKPTCLPSLKPGQALYLQ